MTEASLMRQENKDPGNSPVGGLRMICTTEHLLKFKAWHSNLGLAITFLTPPTPCLEQQSPRSDPFIPKTEWQNIETVTWVSMTVQSHHTLLPPFCLFCCLVQRLQFPCQITAAPHAHIKCCNSFLIWFDAVTPIVNWAGVCLICAKHKRLFFSV